MEVVWVSKLSFSRMYALGIQQQFVASRYFTNSHAGGVLLPIVFNHLEPKIGFGWATRTIAFIMLCTLSISLVVMVICSSSSFALAH